MSADNIILGRNAVYSTDPAVTMLNNNRIVVAPSGGGKTMSVAEPILLNTCESSVVVPVTKARLVSQYAPMFTARGYRTEVLDFVHPEKSSLSYNPLVYLKTHADISFLAKGITADPRKASSHADPYWDKSAESLCCALIARELLRGDSPNFANVLDDITGLKVTESRQDNLVHTGLDEFFDGLEDRMQRNRRHHRSEPLVEFAVTCWKTFKQLPIKTASCIYSTLATEVDTVYTPELRDMMRKPDTLNIDDIGRRRTALFIITSPVNPALHTFVNGVYATVFKQLFEFAERQPDGRLPVPVHVLCDDFATGGRIADFAELISIFREKRISATLLLQSESQLIGMYGEADATTILNNCDTYVFMGTNDLHTAHSVSQRLNVPMDEVLYQPLDQVVIFRRGSRPVVTKRYDILNDKKYQEVVSVYEKSLAR